MYILYYAGATAIWTPGDRVYRPPEWWSQMLFPWDHTSSLWMVPGTIEEDSVAVSPTHTVARGEV